MDRRKNLEFYSLKYLISCCISRIYLLCVVKIIAKMKRRWIICAYTQDKTCRTYFMKGYIMRSKYHWYAEYVPPCKVLVCLIQTNLLKWCKSNIYSPLISFIILCPYGDKISTSRICRYKRTIKMSKVFVYRQESDKIC